MQINPDRTDIPTNKQTNKQTNKHTQLNWASTLDKSVTLSSLQVCFKCKEVIKTSSVKHDGNAYHSSCFTCVHCDEPLAGKPFTKHEGETVCQACYRKKLAKRCDNCESLIEGSVKFVTYGEKFYHRECFTCSKCSKPLAGEKFRLNGAQKVCIACDDESS